MIMFWSGYTDASLFKIRTSNSLKLCIGAVQHIKQVIYSEQLLIIWHLTFVDILRTLVSEMESKTSQPLLTQKLAAQLQAVL